jgi:hypothetical protein
MKLDRIELKTAVLYEGRRCLVVARWNVDGQYLYDLLTANGSQQEIINRIGADELTKDQDHG